MAVTILGSVAFGNLTPAAPDTSITVAHTLSAGTNRRVIVVAAAEAGAQEIVSATYGGQSMTVISALSSPESNALHTTVFGLVEANLPADGSNNAIVTFSGNIGSVRVQVLALQDADQSAIAAAQVASASNTTGLSTTISDDLTSITDGYIVAGGVVHDIDNSNFTFSGGTLGTEVEHEGVNGFDLGSSSNYNLSSIPVTTGGTTTVTFENTEGGLDAHNMIAVCFSPAAGGEVGGGSAGMPAHQHVHHPATNVTIFMRERLRKVGNLFVPDRRVLVPVGIRL